MSALEPLIAATITSSIALLFLSALAHKARDWRRFQDALLGYELLPRLAVPGAALLVIVAEAAVVAGCGIPTARRAAVALACLLLVAYALAMALNLARGRARIDCGCSGFGQHRQLAWWMVRRNLLLAALAAPAAWPTAQRALSPLDVLLVACATAALAGLYAAHATLAQNQQLLSR